MRKTILIVDDSAVNRSYLKSILIEHDFDVMEAGRGGEALEMIEDKQPDAMGGGGGGPGGGGLETLKGLRAKGFSFPVIIFTSDDKEETKKRCLDAGANGFLFKPSKPSQIFQTIEKALAGK